MTQRKPMRLLICFLLLLQTSFSQNIRKIDSLKRTLQTLKDPAKIAGNLCKISNQYFVIDQDSALNNAFRALDIAKKNGLEELIADAYIEIGNNLSNRLGPDTGNYYFVEAGRIYEKTKRTRAAVMAIQNVGINYGRKGELKTAIEYFFKALKLTDALKDSLTEIDIKRNLGTAYFYYNEYDLAVKYLNESYNYYKRKGMIKEIGDCANNLGILYSDKEEIEKAKFYLEESVECAKKAGDTIGLITTYLNVANTIKDLSQFSTAERYYKDGLRLAKQKKQIAAEINYNLGLGNLYQELKKYDEAVKYYDEAITLAKTDNYLYELKFAYHHLSDLYSEKGDYRSAYDYHKLYNAVEDSLYSKENDEVVIQAEAKYQNEKKQLLIDNLNKEKKINEIEIQRQNTIKIGFGIGLVLCVIIAVVLLRGYRLKKRTADELQVKNTIIESQKHEVEEKQKEILDSIGYAKRLQDAILPPKNLWKGCLPESFVLYKPKDIVAGDFYWLEQKGDLVFVAAADCTGHGVPGAMVSVVCSNALNRAVKEFNLTDPGKILDKVRELVIETFEKSENEVKDGMDISLCVFDQKEKGKERVKIKWAGANNPLWYSENGNMVEITAHKQPIGKTDNAAPFPTMSLEVKKGEIVFLFTDGYADQFGGPKGKKFKYKSFLNLLLKNAPESPDIQKNEINIAFEDWKGHLEQVDDVTVIGIRV